MTSRDRVLAAFAHQEPDHVPCWLGASPEWMERAAQRAGLPDEESLRQHLGDDFRRVFSRYAGPDHAHPLRGLKHPEATYRTPFGIERHGYGYGMPLCSPLKDATTVAEIDAYPWPDPAWVDVSHIRAEAMRFGGRYAILGGEWSPFWHDVIDLMDFEPMVYAMMDYPAVVDACLKQTADYYLAVSRRIFEAAGDAIDIFFIGNDFGAQNGPMIGPDLFRRFLLPQLRRFVDLGREFGKLVLLHSDGSLRSLLPDLIDAGFDGIQSIQPYCHGMELGALKRDFGDRITFVGCVDSQALIEGTAGQARELTRQVLSTMMHGGGFIASPSHDYLLPETPVDNVLVMYETIRACGSYVKKAP